MSSESSKTWGQRATWEPHNGILGCGQDFASIRSQPAQKPPWGFEQSSDTI